LTSTVGKFQEKLPLLLWKAHCSQCLNTYLYFLGEHLDEKYLTTVNRFGRVPAIIDGDKNIIESIAILRYLSATYPISDHWYPRDPVKQAKVDEFLEWQHLGLRLPLSMFFQTKVSESP